MDHIQQSFIVRFDYRVFFTEHIFSAGNALLREYFAGQGAGGAKKILFVIDERVSVLHPGLIGSIRRYFEQISGVALVHEILLVPGGESVKHSEEHFHAVIAAVNRHGIDRHSYIAAIGGGAVLDMTGYAAAVAHRGIRLLRFPTTVLAQNDSGVGVKNSINFFQKKNFLGTFAPPAAVFNDYRFLTTLPDVDWRSGTSEAVKVALIKDSQFCYWLQKNAALIAQRDMPAMRHLIRRCAELHVAHIAGGDPFEMGSSRPLDFGHWSAHKLEQLSDFSIRHGEAVAMGIALDTAYSFVSGRIDESAAVSVVHLLRTLGFAITHPLIAITDAQSPVLTGLAEFREHLGGQLTIMLLDAIGRGVEVHELEPSLLVEASEWLSRQSQ